MFTSTIRIVALFAMVAFAPLASAGQIEGAVYIRSGERSTPLAGAFVEAVRSGRIERPIVDRTGRDGKYRLSGLPPGTYTIRAARDGYGPSESAVISPSGTLVECSRVCPEDPLDFELVLLSVVSGVAVDAQSEPVADAKILLHSAQPLAKAALATADDRGQFRFAGILPGRYILTAEASHGAFRLSTTAHRIELAVGENAEEIRLVLEPRPTFEISGVISDLEARGGSPGLMALRSLSARGRNYSTRLGEGNSFRFENVGDGRYFASASFREQSEGPVFLGVLDVASNLSGLVVTPRPTATLECNVRSSTARTAPISFRVESHEGFPERIVRIDHRATSFDLHGLIPGTYRIMLDSPEFYVEAILQGQEIVPADSVTLPPGSTKLDIVIGSTSASATAVIDRHGNIATPLPLPDRTSVRSVIPEAAPQ